MAKVFIDTNCFIGLTSTAPEIDVDSLNAHQGFVSTLSCHILFYVHKIQVPNQKLNSFIQDFNLIDFGQKILSKSLEGPTNDFEDNVQLHSAAENDCDMFLTLDKELLDMKYFGKTQIISPQNLK